jgi:hypothetical protein
MASHRATQRHVLGMNYVTIEEAAPRLSLKPVALRARCRRCSRRVGKNIVANLGGGITAIKLGTSWRVRFPE